MKLVLNIEAIQVHGSLLQTHELALFQRLLETELSRSLRLKPTQASLDRALLQEPALSLNENTPAALAKALSLSIIGGLDR